MDSSICEPKGMDVMPPETVLGILKAANTLLALLDFLEESPVSVPVFERHYRGILASVIAKYANATPLDEALPTDLPKLIAACMTFRNRPLITKGFYRRDPSMTTDDSPVEICTLYNPMAALRDIVAVWGLIEDAIGTSEYSPKDEDLTAERYEQWEKHLVDDIMLGCDCICSTSSTKLFPSSGHDGYCEHCTCAAGKYATLWSYGIGYARTGFKDVNKKILGQMKALRWYFHKSLL